MRHDVTVKAFCGDCGILLQALRADLDVQPLTFRFSNKERFPHLLDLAIRYLSVTGNSVDAERNVITQRLMCYHSGIASCLCK